MLMRKDGPRMAVRHIMRPHKGYFAKSIHEIAAELGEEDKRGPYTTKYVQATIYRALRKLREEFERRGIDARIVLEALERGII